MPVKRPPVVRIVSEVRDNGGKMLSAKLEVSGNSPVDVEVIRDDSGVAYKVRVILRDQREDGVIWETDWVCYTSQMKTRLWRLTAKKKVGEGNFRDVDRPPRAVHDRAYESARIYLPERGRRPTASREVMEKRSLYGKWAKNFHHRHRK